MFPMECVLVCIVECDMLSTPGNGFLSIQLPLPSNAEDTQSALLGVSYLEIRDKQERWLGEDFREECLGVGTIRRRVMPVGAADTDRAHTVLVRIQSKAIGTNARRGGEGVMS